MKFSFTFIVYQIGFNKLNFFLFSFHNMSCARTCSEAVIAIYKLSNCNFCNFQGFNEIRTHGLRVSAAVLYQLSYEDLNVGSRPAQNWTRARPIWNCSANAANATALICNGTRYIENWAPVHDTTSWISATCLEHEILFPQQNFAKPACNTCVPTF